MTLTSYEFNFGAQLPVFKRYKMLAIDPGGGTGGLFNGNDYAWGFRGIEPDDALKGGWQYIHENYPQVKRVGNVIWDLGDQFVNALTGHTKDAVEASDMQLAGTVRSKIGTTDYSDAISKLRGMNVDAVHLNMAGLDLAYFTKQWKAAGLGDKPLLGNEYLPEMSPIAGNSFENWLFAVDYWQPQDAPNPLSKLFQKHFQESYKKAPTSFYEANFYEAGLAIWELALRVQKNGGDLEQRDRLAEGARPEPGVQERVRQRPQHGRGRSSSTRRPTARRSGRMASGRSSNGKPVQVASFNVGRRRLQVSSRRRREPPARRRQAAPGHPFPSQETTMIQATFLGIHSFREVAQLFANGVVNGAGYGLLGAAFALILGTTGRFHFALSINYTLAAFLAAVFIGDGGLALRAGRRRRAADRGGLQRPVRGGRVPAHWRGGRASARSSPSSSPRWASSSRCRTSCSCNGARRPCRCRGRRRAGPHLERRRLELRRRPGHRGDHPVRCAARAADADRPRPADPCGARQPADGELRGRRRRPDVPGGLRHRRPAGRRGGDLPGAAVLGRRRPWGRRPSSTRWSWRSSPGPRVDRCSRW